MRIRADERPLPPWPTWPLSTTTILPALRFARWNAIAAPITPAPRITISAVVVLEFVLGEISGAGKDREDSPPTVPRAGRMARRLAERFSLAGSRFSVLRFDFIARLC